VSGLLTSFALACFVLTLSANAQIRNSRAEDTPASTGTDVGTTVRGEVAGAAQYPGGALLVAFRSSDGFARSADVSGSGSFQLMDLPVGTYEVAVTDQLGNVLCRDMVTVPSPAVTLQLPEAARRGTGTIAGTVSMARLQHKVPDKAVKEFEKALAALKRSDREKGFEHLQKAVDVDPEFMEAYNNLGVQYMFQGETARALDAFDHAAKLDPGSARAAANCGAALFNLKRYKEAATAARRAVDLDGSMSKARYTLGMALAASGDNPDEAEHNLRMTADQYPPARLALAQVLENKGETNQAREQLRTYLASGNPVQRDKVEQWLKEISH
jgi:Tfp pilus assembly protein PilF